MCCNRWKLEDVDKQGGHGVEEGEHAHDPHDQDPADLAFGGCRDTDGVVETAHQAVVEPERDQSGGDGDAEQERQHIQRYEASHRLGTTLYNSRKLTSTTAVVAAGFPLL